VVTGATIREGKLMTRATTWENEPSGEEGAATAEYAIATMVAVVMATIRQEVSLHIAMGKFTSSHEIKLE
jgi:Flp pilus assembly pilin Flp